MRIIIRSRKIKRLFITLFLLLVSLGGTITLLTFAWSRYGISEFETQKSYDINYIQGTGSVNLKFQLQHDMAYTLHSWLILQTTSTGGVENVGISYIRVNIYLDDQVKASDQKSFNEPVKFYHVSLGIDNVFKDETNVSCRGRVDVKFNVDNIIQNETILFEMSIVIPIDPAKTFYEQDLPIIWIIFLLLLAVITIMGFIFRTIRLIRFEYGYTEEERKRDEEFFGYISKKKKE